MTALHEGGRGGLGNAGAGVRVVAALAIAAALAALGAHAGSALATPSSATHAALGAVASSASPEASATTTTPPVSVLVTIGTSVRGRPIVLERFGSGRRHILVMGGIHGNEYGAPVAEAFARYVRAHPSVVPSGTQLDLVAVANPDGRAAHRRGNAHNVDLNRNFPARNWNRSRGQSGTSPGSKPASEPETRALLGVLASQRYVRVVSLHSKGGLIDWDGPGGPTLSRRMAKASHFRVVRLPIYHGSMGAFVPERYRIPIITWELSSATMSSRVRAGLLAALR